MRISSWVLKVQAQHTRQKLGQHNVATIKNRYKDEIMTTERRNSTPGNVTKVKQIMLLNGQERTALIGYFQVLGSARAGVLAEVETGRVEITRDLPIAQV